MDLNEFETVIETETGEKDESYLIDEMSGKIFLRHLSCLFTFLSFENKHFWFCLLFDTYLLIITIGNKKNRQFKKKDEVALNEKGDQWYDDIVDFQNRRESIQEFLKDNSRRGSLYYG